jgi:hypothetical protein
MWLGTVVHRLLTGYPQDIHRRSLLWRVTFFGAALALLLAAVDRSWVGAVLALLVIERLLAIRADSE